MPKAAHVWGSLGHICQADLAAAWETAALLSMRKEWDYTRANHKSQGVPREIRRLVCGIQCLWNKSHLGTKTIEIQTWSRARVTFSSGGQWPPEPRPPLRPCCAIPAKAILITIPVDSPAPPLFDLRRQPSLEHTQGMAGLGALIKLSLDL